MGTYGTIIALFVLLFAGSFFGIWEIEAWIAIGMFALVIFFANFLIDFVEAPDKTILTHVLMSITLAVAIYVVLGILTYIGINVPAVVYTPTPAVI